MFGLGFQELLCLAVVGVALAGLVLLITRLGRLSPRRDTDLEEENRRLREENERLRKGT